MYERILVPLDGSIVGEAALPYVEDLVSKLSPKVKVEVTLLQVLSSTPTPVVGGYESVAVSYSDKQMEETSKKAMDYLDGTGKAFKHVF